MPKYLVPCDKDIGGQIVAFRKAIDEMHSGAVFLLVRVSAPLNSEVFC